MFYFSDYLADFSFTDKIDKNKIQIGHDFWLKIRTFATKIKYIYSMWTELSDTAILKKVGARMKTCRISRGLKQQELADESGVGVSTIAKIENGQSVAFSLLISVMRTLGLLENLDLLVPEQKPSPMELLRTQGKKVKRVRTKKDKE